MRFEVGVNKRNEEAQGTEKIKRFKRDILGNARYRKELLDAIALRACFCKTDGISLLFVDTALVVRHGLDDSPLLFLIQVIQLLHIFIVQLEVVQISIALNPAWRIALWQWYPVLLQAVPDQYLTSRDVVLLCY